MGVAIQWLNDLNVNSLKNMKLKIDENWIMISEKSL